MSPGTLSLSSDELGHAADLLLAAKKVLLLGHINPDADALGSAGALALGLRAKGIEAIVSFDQPDQVPASLAGLPGMGQVRRASELLADPHALSDLDVIVIVDSGSADRVGRFGRYLDGDAPVIVVDHHASNAGFGDLNLIDPSADAAVLVAHRLLLRLDLPDDRQLHRDIATLLYAGLATDTGNFRHATAESHRVAAELLEAGVVPEVVMQPIIDAHPFGWMRMLGGVLGRAELHPEVAGGAGLVVTSVTLRDAQGLRQEEADAVIDILRTSDEAELAVVLKENENGWAVSMRSRGDVSVGDAAVALGGGGHAKAAGFTWTGSYADGLATLIDTLNSTADNPAGKNL